MTTTTTMAPWWLTPPCPSWCHKDHDASQYPNNRLHYSEGTTAVGWITLTLADVPRPPDHAPYDDVPCLDSYLVQHWREAEPRVVLTVNEAEGRYGTDNHRG